MNKNLHKSKKKNSKSVIEDVDTGALLRSSWEIIATDWLPNLKGTETLSHIIKVLRNYNNSKYKTIRAWGVT